MTRQLFAEITLTLRVLIRLPGFWVPTILFPAMLYAFFGMQSADTPWAMNSVASFAIYAVLGVGFFQFGVSVAQDRESAFALWQRSLPGNAVFPWIARILASLIFVMAAVGLVIAVATWIAGVQLGAAPLFRLLGACVIAAITATLMGTALGSLASSRAAVPLANLIYLPLAYLGGLWVPPFVMPAAINAVSEWTPTRAMGELGWAAVQGQTISAHYATLLVVWTLVAAGITWFAQRRSRKALFG